MVATKWLARAAMAAGWFALLTTGAGAVTLNVVGGGLEAANANYGCPTAPGNCSIAARDYALSGSAIAVGSITFDGTVIGISLFVGSVTFTGPGAPVTFGPATYLASISGAGVSTTATGFSGIGNGTITGDVNSSPFSIPSASVNINCDYPGGTGQCGVSFGEGGFTNILGRDWKHQFDVTVALPEPTTALLVALGLVGLSCRSRKI